MNGTMNGATVLKRPRQVGTYATVWAFAVVGVFAGTGLCSEPEEPASTDRMSSLFEWPGILGDLRCGTPASCGVLGAPLVIISGAGDPTSLLVLLDGMPLNDPQTGAVDWTALSPTSVGFQDADKGKRGGCRRGGALGRDGALDGTVRLAGKQGRLDIPVSSVQFLQGPKGYKRSSAEFGRGLGAGWGMHLGGEKVRGSPTASVMRHSVDHLAAGLEGSLPGDWSARLTVRKADSERRWNPVDAEPEGLLQSQTRREAGLLLTGRGLGGARITASLWSRKLRTGEEDLTGVALVDAHDRVFGGLASGEWEVGDGHTVGIAFDAERSTLEWLHEDARVEWRGGLWIGDDIAWGEGEVRAGIRADRHERWEGATGGELAWTRPLRGMQLETCVHRGFRTPSELERRYAEVSPEPALRTGVRVRFDQATETSQRGCCAFAWWEENHPVWGTVGLDAGVGRRWQVVSGTARSFGAVFWGKCTKTWGRSGATVWLDRTRQSGGQSLPLCPFFRTAFELEVRRPLPLRALAMLLGVSGYGWSEAVLPEGGEQKAGVAADLLAGFELASFRILGGIRNLLDSRLSESPMLPLVEREAVDSTRLWCVPRYAVQSRREFYFALSITLYD